MPSLVSVEKRCLEDPERPSEASPDKTLSETLLESAEWGLAMMEMGSSPCVVIMPISASDSGKSPGSVCGNYSRYLWRPAPQRAGSRHYVVTIAVDPSG
jgi:hypothetical protein